MNAPFSGRDYSSGVTVNNYFTVNVGAMSSYINYTFYLNTNSAVDGSGLPAFNMTASLGGNVIYTGDARVSQIIMPIATDDYTVTVDGYSLSVTLSVFYVSPTGSNSNSGTSTSAPLQTIAAALGKITNYGTIYLMAGTHTGSGIGITKNVNIIGVSGANVILKANGGRHFSITGAYTVKFQNIKFINGKASEGGAIYISAGNVTINNSTFTNNTASWGGAIDIVGGGNVNITNSTFTNNTASGGAIFITGSRVNIGITNCRIYNNSASQVHVSSGTVTANSNWWGKNNPTSGTDYSGITISNYFVANATFNGTHIKYRFYLNTNQNIDGSGLPAFNMTIKSGGNVVYTGNARVSQTYTPSAGNYTLFVDGYSFYIGDVLYVSPTGNDANLGNTSTNPLRTIATALERIRNGGTIYLMAGTHTGSGIAISKSVNIIGVAGANVVLDAAKAGRHFIITGAYTVKFQNIKFINGYLDNYGASIFINNANAKVEIANVTFMNNRAYDENMGGAIYIENGNVIIGNSTFTNNTVGDSYAGAIAIEGGSVIIGNSTFTNNKANYEAGAISISDSNVTISNCTFTNNSVTDYGGAIDINNANVNITNSTFTNNKANDGAAIRISNSNVNIRNSIFTNNTADYGAISIGFGNGNVNISNSTFKNNTASSNGAAINIGGGNVTISNSIFTNNTAYYGGAIDINNGNVTIRNSTFTNNKASSEYGGAIYIYYGVDSAGSVIIGNSTFINNTANGDYGGAIYIDNSNVTISNSTFTNNTANYQGGAIWITGGSVTINNSTFINNTASSYGGAIYIENGNVSIRNSTFINNKANGDQGGAINIDGGNLTINNSTFINNSASSEGGAIYINGVSSVIIGNSTFKNNRGNYGGAMEIGGGSLIVGNCTFINNEAYDSHGGAISIYTGNNNVTIRNSTFINNTASSYGGAIYISSGNVSISYCRIYNNSGSSQVYRSGGTVTANSNWWGNNTPVSGRDYTGFTINNYFMVNATFNGNNIINYSFYLNNNQNINGNGLPAFNMTISSNGNILYTRDARVSQTLTLSAGTYTLSVDGYSMTFGATV
jgi:predicted outer membrane repeat protein